MKRMAWIRIVGLGVFAVLLNACQLPGVPLYMPAGFAASGQGLVSPLAAPASGQELQQPAPASSPLAYMGPESAVLVDADSPDCVGVAGLDGYAMVWHTAIEPRPVDGVIQRYSLRPSIDEMRLMVTRTDDQGCNVYGGDVLIDPQSGAESVMAASYAVGDLFYSYCKACPLPNSGHWNVDRRPQEDFPNRSPLGLTPTSIGFFSVQQLVTQSSIVGDEEMNGFATVHRRFTDRQALYDSVRGQMGGAPDDPLEVTTAQIDMWLTRDTHRLVRLRFHAEGQAQGITEAGVLHPFALTDEFNLTVLDRSTQVVVPDEVLDAVAEQLKVLEGE